MENIIYWSSRVYENIVYEYNACLLIENELFPLIRLLKWKNTRFRLFAVNDAQKLDAVPIYSMGTVWSCLKSQKCNVIKVYDMRTLTYKESKNILNYEWMFMNADLRYIVSNAYFVIFLYNRYIRDKRSQSVYIFIWWNCIIKHAYWFMCTKTFIRRVQKENKPLTIRPSLHLFIEQKLVTKVIM